MDERQTKITEGAGLEESRINQDLLDFLNKWSGPVLILVALVVLGMWGKRWLDAKHAAYVDEAFSAYTAAISGGNPSPESLRQVADDYHDVGGVADMARATTADLYLEAAWLGLRPGATINPDGSPNDEADVLTDQQVQEYLASARDLYQQVLDSAEPGGRSLLAVKAAWGLGAVAASSGDAEGATRSYERAAAIADKAQYKNLASAARAKASEVGDLATAPHLYTDAELPNVLPSDAVDAILNAVTPPTDAPAATEEPTTSDEPAGETPAGDDAPATETPAEPSTDAPASEDDPAPTPEPGTP